MLPEDLCAAASAIGHGRTSAQALLDASLAQASTPANARAYLARFDAAARATAQSVDAQHAAGVPLPPLAGLAVSIKALFDVQGHVTTAGSRVLADAPVATADAPAVARLRRAGAALTGHTNLSEFAFSGVGINPHHGTPANAAALALDAQTPRIPGGSTSGGATSVASGAAWAALGSDTGGSIRIPAALQGLVGFKNTARLVPTEGAVPLSTTMDTVCAITRSVRDAVRLHEVLAARTVALERRPLAQRRFAVVAKPFLDGLEPPVAGAFDAALRVLRDDGAMIDELPALPEAALLDAIVALGGFSPPEAWAWHRETITRREAEYDPRVAKRIRRGEQLSAADYIELLSLRRRWIAAMQSALAPYDALLAPTVPLVAPPLAPLVDDDARFFAVNGLLLRNTSIVNVLDGCATSLPCHAPGEWPVGLMVWGPALADDRVLDVSLAVEAVLARARQRRA